MIQHLKNFFQGELRIKKFETFQTISASKSYKSLNLENLEKLEKLESLEMLENLERLEKLEKLEKLEQLEKLEKIKKLENLEKPENLEKLENFEKLELVEKLEILNLGLCETPCTSNIKTPNNILNVASTQMDSLDLSSKLIKVFLTLKKMSLLFETQCFLQRSIKQLSCFLLSRFAIYDFFLSDRTGN